jgi:hypothetical protein
VRVSPDILSGHRVRLLCARACVWRQGLVADALVLRPEFYRGPTSAFKSQWLRDALKEAARVTGRPVAAEVHVGRGGWRGTQRERERGRRRRNGGSDT